MECSNAILTSLSSPPSQTPPPPAWQTWRGEELIEEHFFYDPAMMKTSRPAVATG